MVSWELSYKSKLTKETINQVRQEPHWDPNHVEKTKTAKIMITLWTVNTSKHFLFITITYIMKCIKIAHSHLFACVQLLKKQKKKNKKGSSLGLRAVVTYTKPQRLETVHSYLTHVASLIAACLSRIGGQDGRGTEWLTHWHLILGNTRDSRVQQGW